MSLSWIVLYNLLNSLVSQYFQKVKSFFLLFLHFLSELSIIIDNYMLKVLMPVIWIASSWKERRIIQILQKSLLRHKVKIKFRPHTQKTNIKSNSWRLYRWGNVCYIFIWLIWQVEGIHQNYFVKIRTYFAILYC